MPAGSAELASGRAPAAPDFAYEARLWRAGYAPVAGVDEAGRGAWAGPVVAAAVILPADHGLPVRDSKQLAPARREALADRIRDVAVSWAVGIASAAEVDERNVLGATHLAAARAIAALRPAPVALVTDYLRLGICVAELAPPRADQRSAQVAAASILAKTVRDAGMVEVDRSWPGYGFASNKGYGSPAHRQALDRQGPCPVHRRSFRPVAQGGLFGD